MKKYNTGIMSSKIELLADSKEELEWRSRIIPVLWWVTSDLLWIATYFVFFK